MEIFQSFYYSTIAYRQKEIEYTLNKNLNNDVVKYIHLFIEDNDYVLFNKSIFITHDNYNKIKLVNFKGQPTYKDLFTYCSKLINTICCICNSDIEFRIEQNDIRLLDNLYNKKLIYFLTRHEHDMSCPLIKKFGGSHDAFIFHSNMLQCNLNNTDLSFINYIQNTSGIEAILTLFFIEHLNYNILNPCYQIKLIHHHSSRVRLWNKTQTGKRIIGYTSLKPLNLKHGVHNKHMIYPIKL